jgi:hypothetical protein
LYKKLVLLGEGFCLYNAALVRQLCADILAEKGPIRVEKLIDLMQAVIREDQEEIRIRMAFLAKKYADVVAKSKAAD